MNMVQDTTYGRWGYVVSERYPIYPIWPLGYPIMGIRRGATECGCYSAHTCMLRSCIALCSQVQAYVPVLWQQVTP